MIFMGLLIIISTNSCKKDTQGINNPIMKLSNNNVIGLSYQIDTIRVSISSPIGIKSLIITKGVNLKQDNTYGTNGVLTVSPNTTGQKTWVYTFTYMFNPAEVGKLVGFNFRAVDVNDNASVTDLTVNTTVSNFQLLSAYKWNITNEVDLTANALALQPCQTGDYYLFNTDLSMVTGYGPNKCTFDGFNVYTGWALSSNQKTLSITYASVFNATQITTDSYTIKTLTNRQLILDVYYDLSAFGLSNHELYEFTYTSSAK